MRARLFSLNAVQEEVQAEDGSLRLHIRLPIVDWKRFLSAESLSESDLGLPLLSSTDEFC